jgi:hypothetical protein
VSAYYDDSITSDKLLGLTLECPECGEPGKATGKLLHAANPYTSTWAVEFECARERIKFRIWNDELDPLIKSILREHGKE